MHPVVCSLLVHILSAHRRFAYLRAGKSDLASVKRTLCRKGLLGPPHKPGVVLFAFPADLSAVQSERLDVAQLCLTRKTDCTISRRDSSDELSPTSSASWRATSPGPREVRARMSSGSCTDGHGSA